MDDRELLELAAKAAGIVGVWHERGQCIHVTDCEGMSDIWWRPLTDDGDALRLAVTLGLEANICAPLGKTICWHSRRDAVVEFHDKSDPYIATRRAIVRAAAAVGEAMQ